MLYMFSVKNEKRRREEEKLIIKVCWPLLFAKEVERRLFSSTCFWGLAFYSFSLVPQSVDSLQRLEDVTLLRHTFDPWFCDVSEHSLIPSQSRLKIRLNVSVALALSSASLRRWRHTRRFIHNETRKSQEPRSILFYSFIQSAVERFSDRLCFETTAEVPCVDIANKLEI